MRRGALPAGACLAIVLTTFVAVAQEPPPSVTEPAPAPVPEAPSADPVPPAPPSEAEPAPAPPAAPPSVPAPTPPAATPPVVPPPAAPPLAEFPAESPPPPPVPTTAPAASTTSSPPVPRPEKRLAEDGAAVEPEDDSYGVLGPFRIGPVLSLGLPSLLGFGGMVKLTRYFGAGVNVGLIPEVTFRYYGEAKVSYQEYAAYGHIHPFGGGFFLGAQVGYARVRGSYATTIDLRAYEALFPELPDRVSYTSRATVQTLVLTPEIGYFKIFGSGFGLGADAGLQIPVAPSDITFERGAVSGLPSELSNQALAPHDQKVRNTLEKVGRTILPAFHVRAGFLL